MERYRARFPGSCEIVSCDSHWANTDGMAANGCEDDQRSWTSRKRLAVTTGSNGEWFPDLAVGPNGQIDVVWQESDGGGRNIGHSRYTKSGGWSNEISLDSAAQCRDAVAATDSAGDTMVLWSCDNRVYERRHSSGWGPVSAIDHSSGNSAYWPRIALSGFGDFVAVWNETSSGNKRVANNRYVSGSGWGSPEFVTPSQTHYANIDCNPSDDCLMAWHSVDGSSVSASRHTPPGPLPRPACNH